MAVGARGLRRAAAVAALPVAGIAGAGCGLGNRVGAMQIPAVVSGRVLAGPSCPVSTPGHPCGDLPLPGAVVEAMGKDGTHTVVADAQGNYAIHLLLGYWTLIAVGGVNGRGGRPVALNLVQGQHRSVDLHVDTGIR